MDNNSPQNYRVPADPSCLSDLVQGDCAAHAIPTTSPHPQALPEVSQWMWPENSCFMHTNKNSSCKNIQQIPGAHNLVKREWASKSYTWVQFQANPLRMEIIALCPWASYLPILRLVFLPIKIYLMGSMGRWKKLYIEPSTYKCSIIVAILKTKIIIYIIYKCDNLWIVPFFFPGECRTSRHFLSPPSAKTLYDPTGVWGCNKSWHSYEVVSTTLPHFILELEILSWDLKRFLF